MTRLFCRIIAPLLFLPFTLFGQNGHSPEDSLTNEMIQRALNEEFSSVVSGQSGSNLGNFAALDLSAAEVNFNGNVFIGERSILAIKASGGVADGLLPIFSGNELNSLVKLDLQYNIMSKYYAASRTMNSLQDYQSSVDSIKNKYTQDSLNFAQRQDVLLLEKERIKLLNRQMEQKVLLDSLRQVLKDGSQKKGGKTVALTSLEIQAFNNEVRMAINDSMVNDRKIQAIAERITRSDGPVFRQTKSNQLERAHHKALEKLRSAQMLFGYRINWFSVGYKFGNESFRLFDRTAGFENQITKNNSTTHEFRLQYSIYNYSPASFGSYFLSFGLGVQFGDNLGDLSKSEFVEMEHFGPDSNDRVKTKKYFAFNKSEFEDAKTTFKFVSDFYWFLGSGNNISLHIYPEIKSVTGAKTSFNNGLGLFLAFKDKDSEKEGSVVNTEFYMELKDVFNNNDFEESLFKRSSFGIRFAFPIKFKTNS